MVLGTVRDPEADLVETLAVEPGSIKRLARGYLDKMGVVLPDDVIEMVETQAMAA